MTNFRKFQILFLVAVAHGYEPEHVEHANIILQKPEGVGCGIYGTVVKRGYDHVSIYEIIHNRKSKISFFDALLEAMRFEDKEYLKSLAGDYAIPTNRLSYAQCLEIDFTYLSDSLNPCEWLFDKFEPILSDGINETDNMPNWKHEILEEFYEDFDCNLDNAKMFFEIDYTHLEETPYDPHPFFDEVDAAWNAKTFWEKLEIMTFYKIDRFYWTEDFAVQNSVLNMTIGQNYPHENSDDYINRFKEYYKTATNNEKTAIAAELLW